MAREKITRRFDDVRKALGRLYRGYPIKLAALTASVPDPTLKKSRSQALAHYARVGVALQHLKADGRAVYVGGKGSGWVPK